MIHPHHPKPSARERHAADILAEWSAALHLVGLSPDRIERILIGAVRDQLTRPDTTRHDTKGPDDMPNVNEMYPSKWLTASDLEEEEHTYTIRLIDEEKVGQDKKWLVYFRGVEKALVLNKTNMNTIAGLYGDDTDDWEGKQVTLYPTWVDFQGKQVQAIRIKPKIPKIKTAPSGPPPAAAPVRPKTQPVTQEEADADDPPF